MKDLDKKGYVAVEILVLLFVPGALTLYLVTRFPKIMKLVKKNPKINIAKTV